MNIDFEAIRGWLLGTVKGVIILGVIGSVLGSIFWLLIRALARRIRRSSKHYLVAIAYRRFGRHIEIAEKTRASHLAEAKAYRYILFVVVEAAGFIFDAIIAVAAIGSTCAVSIVYGIERPILLVICISISVPAALECLRSAVYLMSLEDDSVRNTKHRIDSSQPKRYRDFAKAQPPVGQIGER